MGRGILSRRPGWCLAMTPCTDCRPERRLSPSWVRPDTFMEEQFVGPRGCWCCTGMVWLGHCSQAPAVTTLEQRPCSGP